MSRPKQSGGMRWHAMADETVGFIGLGRMGRGMAANLAKAGVPLVAFDLDANAMRSLVALGAQAAISVAELTRRSGAVAARGRRTMRFSPKDA